MIAPATGPLILMVTTAAVSSMGTSPVVGDAPGLFFGPGVSCAALGFAVGVLNVDGKVQQAIVGDPPVVRLILVERHTERVVTPAVPSADGPIDEYRRVRSGRVEDGGDQPLVVVDGHVDRETVDQGGRGGADLPFECHARAAGHDAQR